MDSVAAVFLLHLSSNKRTSRLVVLVILPVRAVNICAFWIEFRWRASQTLHGTLFQSSVEQCESLLYCHPLNSDSSILRLNVLVRPTLFSPKLTRLLWTPHLCLTSFDPKSVLNKRVLQVWHSTTFKLQFRISLGNGLERTEMNHWKGIFIDHSA